MVYRWSDGDGLSDGWMYMVDEWSDDEGQPDRQGKMVYRWSRGDRQSDGWIMGLMGGVTDGHVIDELTGWLTDWSYDGWMGMTDGLAMLQMDSVTDLQVD